MAKRFLIAGSLLVVLSLLLLLVWQPDALKKQVFNHVTKGVSESSPYDLTIGRVSGNLFYGFILHDVRLVTKPDHVELLRAPVVHIGISVWALIHKTLQINRLDWREPTLHLMIDENKHLLLPRLPRSTRTSSTLRYSINEMTLEGGQLIIVNRSFTPTRELILSDIVFKARINAQEMDIDRLQMTLDHGRADLKGRLIVKPSPSSQWILQDQDFPLDRLLSMVIPMPASLRLIHSGEWKVQTESERTTLDMRGRLMDGTIFLHGLWVPAGLERADLTWNRPGLASAVMHVVHGEGSFQVNLTSADFKAVIQGNADLAHRSVHGKGTLEKVAWQGTRLDKMDFTFSANNREQQLDLTADNLSFRENEERPFDLPSLRLSLKGLTPRWQTSALLQFRNHMSADVAGVLTQRRQFWQFDWHRLAIAAPSAGSWTSPRPGYVTLGTGYPIKIQDLYLASGEQTIQIPRAVFEKNSGQMDLFINHFDPGPWAKLYRSDLMLQGQVNASIRLNGQWTDPALDGFINGYINTLAFKPAGVLIQNIDLDLRSSDKTIEIRRFVGKTKKGDVEISGKSRLPTLAYALRARHLILEGNPQLKGTANAEIHLDGTLQSPSLTGHVSLEEATYTVPPPEKKKKSSELAAASSSPTHTLSLWRQGTIDIAMQWPRNVWYRDGISSIETQGDIRLQKHEGTPNVILTGTIRSLRGSYSYYGRAFNIESGEIQFPGTVELNPLLNVEASYTTGSATIYLDLTGPVQQPILKMHSNPQLSEQDIVSVIVFGQPLSELRARTGGPSANQEALQAAGGVLGTYLSKGLSQTGIPELNFDILNIQPADQGGSQLTVGRYLTRRLFITYGQTVQGAAEKTLTADYFLTDKWTLQGASDSVEGNYMDFLFRYPLNKRGAPANNPPLPKSPFRNMLDQPIPGTQFRSPMQ